MSAVAVLVAVVLYSNVFVLVEPRPVSVVTFISLVTVGIAGGADSDIVQSDTDVPLVPLYCNTVTVSDVPEYAVTDAVRKLVAGRAVSASVRTIPLTNDLPDETVKVLLPEPMVFVVALVSVVELIFIAVATVLI